MPLPHALDQVPGLTAIRRTAGRMLVALDFDGTLSPIVERPEAAALHGDVEAPLRRLAERPDTAVAIVSGRGLADVRDRVGIDGLYYAGNHGFEIEGPGVDRTHPAAEDARPLLEAAAAALEDALAEEPGTEVEDKGWTLSIHYRRAEREGAGERVRRAVEEHGRRDGLRVTEGKKVFEIRPDVDWDKGRATEFLLDIIADAESNAASGAGESRADAPGEATDEAPAPPRTLATRVPDAPRLPAIFVGDDRTDEDAFAVVRGLGGGIVVGEPPEGTEAVAWLRGPDEVAELIRRLADG